MTYTLRFEECTGISQRKSFPEEGLRGYKSRESLVEKSSTAGTWGVRRRILEHGLDFLAHYRPSSSGNLLSFLLPPQFWFILPYHTPEP